MIRISGVPLDSSTLIHEYGGSSIEMICLDILQSSSKIYEYNTLNDLKFELNLRAKIVDASIQLYNSRLAFSTSVNPGAILNTGNVRKKEVFC